MSGGSMDYAYAKLNDAASEVRTSAEHYDWPDLRIAIAEHIEKLSKVVKAMEWSDSGDWKRDDWKPLAEQYIGLMDLLQEAE